MNGSSFAGMSCSTSAHSSSGIREGHVMSRTLPIFGMFGEVDAIVEARGESVAETDVTIALAKRVGERVYASYTRHTLWNGRLRTPFFGRLESQCAFRCR